ncbi:unnamed protein product [Spirodela intermedia]|uniref:Uncharacterized protein n=2 Tax=Spirodela intermedia TaxID=51605 RepID=A0A7I8J9A0_SPIIN|nr:unnamed protein product [Spirodela intermedia]CAA6666798.1 unnamed protein product [Spirodela intermedia]CAA7403602.1 unnamed protein product [Spirodela intermedia]
MASSCIRSVSGASRSCLRSYVKQCVLSGSRRASAPGGSTAEATQCPSELGCCSGFLLPVHSAMALMRLNSSLSSTCRFYRSLSQGTLRRTWPGL